MTTYLQTYEQWLVLKNYSSATRQVYLNAVRYFWRWCEAQQRDNAQFQKHNAVFLYLSYRMNTKKYTTVNAEYSGLKHFFVSILGRPWSMDKLPRPRKEKPLPVILSKEEVEALIQASGSFRNQTLLTLIYATGLRLGEAQQLRLCDINSKSMSIHVFNGKGAKDRILPLPADLLLLLREYFMRYRPKEFLFNGDEAGSPLSKRMIQHIVSQARVSAGIRRKASVHTLRHCFATHFYQNGCNGIALQLLLGHKNFRTTIRYVHLSGAHLQHLQHPAEDLCKRLTPLPQQ